MKLFNFNYIVGISLFLAISVAKAASIATSQPGTSEVVTPEATSHLPQECVHLTLKESRDIIHNLLFLKTFTLAETKAKLEKIANESIPKIQNYMDQEGWSDILWVGSIVNRYRDYYLPYNDTKDIIKLFNSIYMQGEDYSQPALDMYISEIKKWIALMDKAIGLHDVCSAQGLPLINIPK